MRRKCLRTTLYPRGHEPQGPSPETREMAQLTHVGCGLTRVTGDPCTVHLDVLLPSERLASLSARFIAGGALTSLLGTRGCPATHPNLNKSKQKMADISTV